MNNPEFKATHSNNVKVKKRKNMKFIMKLVGKLARIFVGIARKNELYFAKKVHLQRTERIPPMLKFGRCDRTFVH